MVGSRSQGVRIILSTRRKVRGHYCVTWFRRKSDLNVKHNSKPTQAVKLAISQNTRDVRPMLGQRRRWWASIGSASSKRIALAWFQRNKCLTNHGPAPRNVMVCNSVASLA